MNLGRYQRTSVISKETVSSARYETKIGFKTETPKSLRRLWSDCVTATIMKFSKAKTDDESFRTLESWVKLKAVLVLPIRGKKRRISNRKFHQNQMLIWIAGNEEQCWNIATEVEQERLTSKKGHNSKQRKWESTEEEEARKML